MSGYHCKGWPNIPLRLGAGPDCQDKRRKVLKAALLAVCASEEALHFYPINPIHLRNLYLETQIDCEAQ